MLLHIVLLILWLLLSDNVDILLNVSKKVTNTENKKAKKINTFQIVGAIVYVFPLTFLALFSSTALLLVTLISIFLAYIQ